ncbi:hypothetical protein [uncultured Dialister sp.]|uniref:hypothetical protein n=1 Tax=uncultured Dialister sp. TaxID=278064 RepID=UPI0027DC16D7|nr:hypothetical protein [uncultured Dialister sp.]
MNQSRWIWFPTSAAVAVEAEEIPLLKSFRKSMRRRQLLQHLLLQSLPRQMKRQLMMSMKSHHTRIRQRQAHLLPVTVLPLHPLTEEAAEAAEAAMEAVKEMETEAAPAVVAEAAMVVVMAAKPGTAVRKTLRQRKPVRP